MTDQDICGVSFWFCIVIATCSVYPVARIAAAIGTIIFCIAIYATA